jgi:integrase
MSEHRTGKLSPDQVTTTAPGRYGDGKGLYLNVRPGGGASWTYQYRVGEKVTEIGLGSRGEVSLEDARTAAQRYRDMRANGQDPKASKSQERKAAVALNSRTTFGELAVKHIAEAIAPGFRGRKTAKDWQRSIEIHAAPLLSKRPADITLDNVADCLRVIWKTKPKTATELRGRIERILNAASVHGLRTGDNPARWAGGLREVLPKPDRAAKHHPAAPYADVPAIVTALRDDVSEFDLSAVALEFLILTAVRTSDVRLMTKKEVNAKSATWTIPADRLKVKDMGDHLVPLSPRALVIFEQQTDDLGPDDFVFPGLKFGQPIGDNAMLHALQRHREGLAVHGFRSSFRDWVSEQTEYGWELGELALAHQVGTKVSRAYARSGRLEKRRPMMTDWAAYVAG